jgi:hypothetical protein
MPSAIRAWAYVATAVQALVGRVKAESTVVKGARRDDSALESIFCIIG